MKMNGMGTMVLSVMLLLGCGNTRTVQPSQCFINSDCGEGLSCFKSQCVYECREDRDCDTNQTCDLVSGYCLNLDAGVGHASQDAGSMRSLVLPDGGNDGGNDSGLGGDSSLSFSTEDAGPGADAMAGDSSTSEYDRAVEICVDLNTAVWCNQFPNSDWSSIEELRATCNPSLESHDECLWAWIEMYQCGIEIFNALPECPPGVPRGYPWVPPCDDDFRTCEAAL